MTPARRLVAYSFLVAFADDGTISEAELAMLKRIALEDGEIDAEEREVLKGLFSRVNRDELEGAVWSKIEEFREANEI